MFWTVRSGAAFQAVNESRPSSPAVGQPGPHVDYRVIVWYRRSRPLETFEYQVYDVRKGEYTAAVDDWLSLMRTKYTGYVVIPRAVDLSREKGKTEALKVGAVVQRELLAAAALAGVVLGEAGGTSSRSTRQAYSTRHRGTQRRFSGSSTMISPAGPTSPVPMPYPRPHP
jgi:hypothetical protein